MVDAFARGEDIYKITAAGIYGIDKEAVDKEQRFVGKVARLGLGYGMGHVKFHDTLRKGAMGPPIDLGAEECARIVYVYRQTNPFIVQLWKTCTEVLTRMAFGHSGTFCNGLFEYGKNYIKLPNGMFLHYYGLQGEETEQGVQFTYADRYGMKKIYGGLLVENLIQALARIIVAWQMLQAYREGYRIVTMTHDEIVAVCPEELADIRMNRLLEIMHTAPEWAQNIPIAAEGGYDVCYSK